MSQLAVRGTKLTVAFSMGWLWIPLFVGALIFVDASHEAVAVVFVVAAAGTFGSAMVLSVVRDAGVRFVALGGLTLGVVLASSAFPVTVPSFDPYTEVGFGYPFHFVFADLAQGNGLQPVPHATTELWNPWEEPALLDAPRFLLSYLTVLAALTAISFGARAALRWVRRPAPGRPSSGQ